ncbi:MAG: SDR family oxidoreductase [Candidatus Komeilibacteria bacterium]|nr:SDR family oxidoreductase [Candidatus Komeilibacteria bacterium]
MRILVTGGAGFIGSHLIDYLMAQGHRVIAVDNFLSGKKANIARHFHNPNFKFIKHDISLPLNAKLGPLDQIYNLACPASPLQYQVNPLKTWQTNVFGTGLMLELARKNSARLLQASTSEVYGDPKEHPQKESYFGNVNPLGDRSCYDEGKRAAETLCYIYRAKYKTDVKIARIFNTYGPRMIFSDGRALPNFIKQALTNEPLTIFGSGRQTRSLMYIDDLILGLVKLMNRPNFFGPVNLGNPNQEINILALAKKTIKLCHSKSQLKFQALPEDDPIKRRPAIALAKKTLGWSPGVSLEQGLKATIKDFKARLNNPAAK